MRAALIGLGMVSGTFASALRASKTVDLASVFARTEASRTTFLEENVDLGAKAAASVEDIADDPSIDFAIVATPPDARAGIVDTLIASKKPVLLEKPIERSYAAAKMIVERCEAANVPLGVVLQHRARPLVQDLLARIPVLGDILAIEVSVPWWRPQSYYDAPGRGTYARDGGGVLLTQAIHTLDLMLALGGPVREVTAMTATTGFHSMEAEDFVSAGLTFVSGAVGTVYATTASYPGEGEVITLHCRNGSARIAAGVLHLNWRDGRQEQLGAQTASGAGADPMAFTSDWHQTVIEQFALGRPVVTGREALEVHRLIAAMERSGHQGRKTALKDIG